MKGLSSKETEIIANLEFTKGYYFTRDDIKRFFSSDNQIRHTIDKLMQKGRIIKLNRNKYYLVPIRARTGVWTDHPFIIADEIFNGKDYFIGGWAAANYWDLTEQLPMRIDIWTTKKEGTKKVMGVVYKYHRTTKNRLLAAVTKYVDNHPFRVLNKEKTKQWLQLRT